MSFVGPPRQTSSSGTLLPFHPSTKGRNHALRRYCRAIRREEGALDDKYSLMDGHSACREIILSGPFVALSWPYLQRRIQIRFRSWRADAKKINDN